MVFLQLIVTSRASFRKHLGAQQQIGPNAWNWLHHCNMLEIHISEVHNVTCDFVRLQLEKNAKNDWLSPNKSEIMFAFVKGSWSTVCRFEKFLFMWRRSLIGRWIEAWESSTNIFLFQIGITNSTNIFLSFLNWKSTNSTNIFLSFFRHASVSSTYPCKLVGWLVSW